MLVLNTMFRRLRDTSVSELLGCIGTYVLWDGKAKARPSYVGEGNILKRLVLHEGKFARPLDGYSAVFEEETWQRSKSHAEILEALLIEIADETDRSPSSNRARGKLRGLDSIFRYHGTVRINVRGFDPFAPPWAARPLADPKIITVKDAGDGQAVLHHEWRYRRPLRSRAAA